MLTGNLDKMLIEPGLVARYFLRLSDQSLELTPYIGKTIRLVFSGVIHCVNCGRATKKSFSQGYCYPCSSKLAACDLCIMQPERCHYEQGTCREPEWGLQHCFQPHIVYLANSSGLKVGITRLSQLPTRWLDQGASQALPMYRVTSRYISGLLESNLKQFVSDKTDWRKLLKSDAELLDLQAERTRLYQLNEDCELQLQQRFGVAAIERLPTEVVQQFAYPVTLYPAKVNSLGFDKQAEVSGVLQGIKGQYLIIDGKVLNLRKHTGYVVSFEVLDSF